MRHYSELPDLPARAFRKAPGKNRPETLEGGKGGSAPQAPDPWVVAGASTQTNQDTAAFNKALNLNNSSNPFGSQTSSITGYDPQTGAPIYQTNVSANPQLQQMLTGTMQNANNAGWFTNNSIYGLGGVISQLGDLNKSIDPAAAQAAQQQGQNAAYSAQTQYLDPRFQQQQTSLESQLANQGLTPGSQAYDNAVKNFNLSRNQAYSDAANQSVLTGSQIGSQMLQNQLSTAAQKANMLNQQGVNYGQMASLAQLPFSQLATLAGLVPGNSGTAQSSAAPANVAQAFQNQYQGQMNAYNQDVASANSTMGGLFGLGTAGMIALAMSDPRVKTDIEPIGRLKDGVNFYSYRYIWDAPGTERMGVMADEVKKVQPEAVVRHPSGFDMVDYDKVFRE